MPRVIGELYVKTTRDTTHLPQRPKSGPRTPRALGGREALIAGGVQNGVATVEDSLVVSSQTKHTLFFFF